MFTTIFYPQKYLTEGRESDLYFIDTGRLIPKTPKKNCCIRNTGIARLVCIEQGEPEDSNNKGRRTEEEL